MADEFNEQELDERSREHFKSLRRTVSINGEGTDFVAEGEGSGVDEARIRELEKVMIKIVLAGSSAGQDTRLYEKADPVMRLIAKGVRIVDGERILNIGSWDNLRMYDWAFTDPEFLAQVQRARELVASGKPLQVESLFTSLAKQAEADALIGKTLGRGFDIDALANNPELLLGRCRDLGIAAVSSGSGYPRLEHPMDEAIYGTYANIIRRNSVLSGSRMAVENRYFASGLMHEINDVAKPPFQTVRQGTG